MKTGKGMLPPLSLANGVDFGSAARIGLVDMTLAEKLVVAKARLFAVVVKLRPGSGSGSQQALKGHVIAFDSPGPEVACALYPRLHRLADSISVQFVGSKGQLQASMRRALGCTDLQVRPAVVYAWLRALKALHPEYRDIEIDASPATQAALANAAQQLLASVVLIDSPVDVMMEALTASSRPGGEGDTEATDVDAESSASATGSHGAVLEHVHVTSSQHPTPTETVASMLESVALLLANCDGDSKQAEGDGDVMTSPSAAGPTVPPSVLPAAATAPAAPTLVIGQASTPINEFTSNDVLLYSAYPHLFLTGRGLGTHTAGVPEHVRQHILHQFTCAFARDQRLLFTLLDQLQRHKTSQVLAARVKNDPAAFAAFAAAAADPAFRVKLAEALRDPDGRTAGQVLQQVMKFVTVIGQDAPFGALQRKQVAAQIHALVHRFGLPFLFLTVSVDDTHSALNMRMSFPSTSNTHFPATTTDTGGAEFLSFLEGSQLEFGSVKLSKAHLDKLLAENPVAAAACFQRTMEAIHTTLLGVRMDHNTKTSTPFNSDPHPDVEGNAKTFTEYSGGLFGPVTASFCVIEAQGRGRQVTTIASFIRLPTLCIACRDIVLTL